ncbi:MAG TPA: N-formylglutamate amidohydrolase [Candidatus Krumholzibacteria bacterium]|nr:N-formylglutamate amidohydrolase [Candidatus Krumholzibacteria bacterium]
MRRREPGLVISCEHAGNRVPAQYRSRFRGASAVLKSHRGWDPGSLDLARAIAFAANVPLLANTTSRLVVECNRSLGHPQLFSEFTRDLDPAEKFQLLALFYHPHRRAVELAVHRAIRRHGRVVHIGVHTFTSVFKDKRRRADVGLLFDPGRRFERDVVDALSTELRARAPKLRVRRNYPYRGWTDGLTTTLRGRSPAASYAGIELEVNQALVANLSRRRAIQRQLAEAVRVIGTSI